MDLQFLKNYGIDIHSGHTAVETCREADHGPDAYRDIIRGVLNFDPLKPISISDEEAPIVARYVVYAAITTPNSLDLNNAIAKAKAFLTKNPQHVHVVAVEVDEDGDTVPTPKKLPKGFKKQTALRLYRENQGQITDRKEWITLLIDELPDLNPGTANTYIHNIENNKAGWEL